MFGDSGPLRNVQDKTYLKHLVDLRRIAENTPDYRIPGLLFLTLVHPPKKEMVAGISLLNLETLQICSVLSLLSVIQEYPSEVYDLNLDLLVRGGVLQLLTFISGKQRTSEKAKTLI